METNQVNPNLIKEATKFVENFKFSHAATAPPEMVPEVQSLKDISDDELVEIFNKEFHRYENSASFIQEYYGIKTTRQAVYNRLKRILAARAKKASDLKENARTTLAQALDSNNDLNLRIQAARIILNPNNW